MPIGCSRVVIGGDGGRSGSILSLPSPPTSKSFRARHEGPSPPRTGVAGWRPVKPPDLIGNAATSHRPRSARPYRPVRANPPPGSCWSRSRRCGRGRCPLGVGLSGYPGDVDRAAVCTGHDSPPRGRTRDQGSFFFSRWLRCIGSDTFALRHYSSAAVEPWYSFPPKMPAQKAAGEVAGATT